MPATLPEQGLLQQWSLSPADIDFITSRHMGTRLGLAVQLKFFASHGFFASSRDAIPADALSYVAEQIGLEAADLQGYDFTNRSARRHCAEILEYLGFRRMQRAERQELTHWIAGELCPTGRPLGEMLDAVCLWCRDRTI